MSRAPASADHPGMVLLTSLEQAGASIVLVAIVVAAFLRVRRVARRSPGKRAGMIVFCLALLGAAAWLAFELPKRIPDTPGSPAALLFWLVPVGLAVLIALFAVPALLGALFCGSAPAPTREGNDAGSELR